MFSKRVGKGWLLWDVAHQNIRNDETFGGVSTGTEWATRVRRIFGAITCHSYDSEDHRPETLISANGTEGMRTCAVGRLKPSTMALLQQGQLPGSAGAVLCGRPHP